MDASHPPELPDEANELVRHRVRQQEKADRLDQKPLCAKLNCSALPKVLFISSAFDARLHSSWRWRIKSEKQPHGLVLRVFRLCSARLGARSWPLRGQQMGDSERAGLASPALRISHGGRVGALLASARKQKNRLRAVSFVSWRKR